MNKVFPKKWLGQHFLTDNDAALKITELLPHDAVNILEIGPGTGVLTQYLLDKNINLKLIEIDSESVSYLKNYFPQTQKIIIEADFLKTDLNALFDENYSIIGNFPYNISSQILFRMLEYKHKITGLAGMFQKEVAERICAGKGSKTYGILSVLVQAFYDTEFIFALPPDAFSPPPKVHSAVIRLTRKNNYTLNCDERTFFRLVKKAFNQRRKKLRNALHEFHFNQNAPADLFQKRAEALSVNDFITLTNALEKE